MTSITTDLESDINNVDPAKDYAVAMVNSPPSAIWLHLFIFGQITCAVLQLVPGTGPIRLPLRVAAFSVSLLFLMILRGGGLPHPSMKAGVLVVIMMLFQLFHPETNSLMSGLAEMMLYLAIISPLFWVPRLEISAAGFRLFLLIIWLYQSLSSFFGYLQVKYPGRFQPQVSSFLEQHAAYLESLYITLADGSSILRPMGLTDNPGGAAGSGMYAALFGVAILVSERSKILKAMAIASIFLGLFCLYLAQVRSLLVMCLVVVIVFFSLLGRRADFKKLFWSLIAVAILSVYSYSSAVDYGGATVTKRVGSLVDTDPVSVYNGNRGIFFRDFWERLIPEGPLGWGSGRWGMMYNYFADHSKPSLWSEIMWQGWSLDGGLPMVLAYTAAIALATLLAYRIAKDKSVGDLGLWAALVCAYNVGAVALCFNCNFFVSQDGMQFWAMNGGLWAAYVYTINNNTNEDLSLASSDLLASELEVAS